MRKVAVVASASGSGKTTVGRELAGRLGVPFVELDALVHGPGWVEISDDELRAQLAPILAGDGWVIDGSYTRKLGGLVTDAADAIVWLDLPMHVWLPRLVLRSQRRLRGLEPLWNGNRETLRGLVGGRESLFGYALRMYFRRRREWPQLFAGSYVVRLRTPAEVAAFLDAAAQGPGGPPDGRPGGPPGGPMERAPAAPPSDVKTP